LCLKGKPHHHGPELLVAMIICDPCLDKFLGPGVIAVNLHNLTIEKHFAFQKLHDGEGMVTFAEELLRLGCSAIFRNEIVLCISVKISCALRCGM